jgi:hypothetical protein
VAEQDLERSDADARGDAAALAEQQQAGRDGQ